MLNLNECLGESLLKQCGVPTRQISAENPTGEKGAGCKWEPNPEDPDLEYSKWAQHLGRGWKVRPFIRVKAHTTVTLADIKGPGCINEFFITSSIANYRQLVLRFYWDGEERPSIEVPMGDFFAMGHDPVPHLVNSLPVVVAPRRGCNSYWQMPFREHARVTLENEGDDDAPVVAYRVLYKLHEVAEATPYFHAQWRRSLTRREHPEHVIVDGVKGCGLYVGNYLAWTSLSRGWWGEGEMKFYIDGDGEFPSMADNGLEDYFGGAWCFGDPDRPGYGKEFSTPFLGMPLAHQGDPQSPRYFSLYRWHLLDAIGFSQDLRVTVQALGLAYGGYLPLTDDVASVGYWYQREPHAPFPTLPGLRERWCR